jgi:hypothetical protein
MEIHSSLSLSHHPQLETQMSGGFRQRDSVFVDSDSAMSASPEAVLSFHSSLSSALYGDDDDLASKSLGVGETYGPDPFTPSSMLSDLSEPATSLANAQSDPFLCGGVSVSNGGHGRNQGVSDGNASGNNVMEEIDLLENFLERIGDCDSGDSVFTTTPTFYGPHNRPSPMEDTLTPTTPSLLDSLSPQSQTSPLTTHSTQPPASVKAASSAMNPESSLLGGSSGVGGGGSSQPASLLRTLLDKEGEPSVTDATPIVQAWARSFPAVTCASDHSPHTPTTQSTHDGKNPSLRVVNATDTARRPQTQGRGNQLVICAGKQAVVPRQVDLTADGGEEEEEKEEAREVRERIDSGSLMGEEGVGGSDCGVSGLPNLPPDLPQDLLDFAMQYCESLSDMDTGLSDAMDVWNDDLMNPEPFGPHLASSLGKQQGSLGKHVEHFLGHKGLTGKVAVAGKRTLVSEKTVDREKMASEEGSGPVKEETVSPPSSKDIVYSAPLSPTSASLIQSAIVSSTRKDGRPPALTVSVRPTPGGGLTGVVITPLAKDKQATILKYGSNPQPSPPAGSGGSSGVKCLKLISPALSDHRYSSPRTHSPHNPHPHPQGKRMRTDGERGAKGKEARQNYVTLPCIPPQPSCVGYKGGYSPRSGSTSPCKSLSGSSEGSGGYGSQPNSPFPPPVPANGGGKPLSAMTELEKHLRGLAGRPDERTDSEDSLPELEDSGSGSRPFLERLLTGEMTHERYRQIDYHLLYQERERRLSENSQRS